ncbi:MAG: hypothetical protein J6A85_06685 [Clostridia bacterium]|nr:hypothetical protein [Clostridia bacterium]
MKKASVIALILGILMLLTSVILPVISVLTSMSASAAQSTGIIGGADTPTFLLLFSLACSGVPTVLAIAALLVIAASVVLLFIAKKKEN